LEAIWREAASAHLCFYDRLLARRAPPRETEVRRANSRVEAAE
jgi:hypothetical protein